MPLCIAKMKKAEGALRMQNKSVAPLALSRPRHALGDLGTKH